MIKSGIYTKLLDPDKVDLLHKTLATGELAALKRLLPAPDDLVGAE